MKNVEHFGDLTKRMNTFREKVLDEKSSAVYRNCGGTGADFRDS